VRFDVITKGPLVLSSHEEAQEAAEAAKKVAADEDRLVEVWDKDLKKTIFRARGIQWRWITR
jgi:hypothetical protein